jgi:hypothetical protein
MSATRTAEHRDGKCFQPREGHINLALLDHKCF